MPYLSVATQESSLKCSLQFQFFTFCSMQKMNVVSHLSPSCHQSLDQQQPHNQCIVSKQLKAMHCYAFIATFRVVSEGKGSPQRYVLPVSWKQSMPCQEHACVLAAPGTGCPDPAGAKARGRRWLLPGRLWLSLGVAGCQKISICQQGQGCQASANRVQCHHLQAEGNPQEDTQVPQAGSIHLLPSVLVALVA